MLTVVASMEQEVAGLRRELHHRAAGKIPRSAQGGRVSLIPEVRVIGVGEAQAFEAAGELLESGRRSPACPPQPPHRLLMVGFAGGVDPALGAGQLVLASRYYLAAPTCRFSGAAPSHNNGGAGIFASFKSGGWELFLSPDPEMWREGVEAAAEAGAPGACQGACVDSLTVGRLVTSPEGKQALRHRYPVGVVNMEDYWVAKAAREAGVPFLSARVVLDPADEALPSHLLGLSRSGTGAVLRIAGQPWRLPAVVRLALRVPSAQRVIARFVLALVERLNRIDAAGLVTSAVVPQAWRSPGQ